MQRIVGPAVFITVSVLLLSPAAWADFRLPDVGVSDCRCDKDCKVLSLKYCNHDSYGYGECSNALPGTPCSDAGDGRPRKDFGPDGTYPDGPESDLPARDLGEAGIPPDAGVDSTLPDGPESDLPARDLGADEQGSRIPEWGVPDGDEYQTDGTPSAVDMGVHVMPDAMGAHGDAGLGGGPSGADAGPGGLVDDRGGCQIGAGPGGGALIMIFLMGLFIRRRWS